MLNAVIVGAGHRALGYAKYAELHPDRLRVVGVADLFPERRQAVARLYSLPPENCANLRRGCIRPGTRS